MLEWLVGGVLTRRILAMFEGSKKDPRGTIKGLGSWARDLQVLLRQRTMILDLPIQSDTSQDTTLLKFFENRKKIPLGESKP